MCERCGSEYCGRVVRASDGSWSWMLLHDGKEFDREDGFRSEGFAVDDLAEFVQHLDAVLDARGYGGGSAPCRPIAS